nr:hypothetical protein [Vibrio parahaemolyticus]
MVTALCGSFSIACLHPLTRRYVTEMRFNEKGNKLERTEN